MEKFYTRTAYPLSSEEISLRKYLEETKENVKQYVKNDLAHKTANFKNKDREKVILSMMGDQYDSDTFKRLSLACSSDLLRVDGQPPAVDISTAKRTPKLFKSTMLPETSLSTLRRRKHGERISPQSLRYTSCIWLDHRPSTFDQNKRQRPGQRLVIVVKVYQPFKHRIGQSVRRVPVPTQEICLLESTTLAEFRDKISCISDEVVSCDISDSPFEKDMEKGKDKYPSGMFYIDNKFYIDKRHPESIDYSYVIRDWARNRSLNLNLQEPSLMERTRLIDLKVRLGFPYVYQHQGDCEHLFCFSDVRLLHESDPLQESSYPVDRCYFRRYLPHCMCCSTALARWVTLNNKRVPHDPFYFCEDCYISFNYKNGEKVGEFEAYPFVYDQCTL